ncbi:cell wall metabolism sensor histidine kinase WalK [Acidovorax sp. Leaf160]|uniref:sensor histidine kinase n=1 Tax=Acidovorax sp. Leaf160 TaxID=1736280 RepID=UPI0006FB119A|nr:ATP-binding protein [Acidovorax sp. Leaf160]KQR41482.1 histidine kinase [Acidovorax sp. Leaf160]
MTPHGPLLQRVWVRFGLCIAATVVATMALLAGSVTLFSEMQYRDFYRGLPAPVQREMDDLRDRGEEDGPRAMEIYARYWQGDLLFGEKWSLVVGLVVCLPVGLVVGFWVSRIVTQPLASMAEVATHVAEGDFSVRAQPGRMHDEMSSTVRHFNQMIDSLERMAKERRATTASISHELRTPLAVLRARLHAICDGVIEADAAESRGLLDQVEYLGRLVGDLHTLSMAEAGQLSLETAPVDLVDLVREALAGHAQRIADHGLELALEVPADGGPVWALADPDRVRQILFNLVENALKHAASGRWLGVEVAVADGTALLTVSDAGQGLPQHMADGPFERFPHPAGRRGEGSGLGLSIVRALAERQQGKVRVESRPEGGTRFVVQLPRANVA